MAPTSRKQTHCAAVDRPLGRVGVNSSDTQDTQLHPDSECSATEEPTTTIVHALAKFQAILNCKLDDFDTYNDFYLAFNKAVNEFEALPGSEKLHEQIKFLMFASNLGPWFRPWINFLSESRNLVGIGSKKGERVGFHQFDREIRNYGLNAARHKFWEKRIQWRSHGRLEIIDSTGWIPKWLYAHSPGQPHHIARLRGPFRSTCTLPGHERSPHTNGACRTQCPHLRDGFIPDEEDVMAQSWD